jgi:hypothetical protein
VANVLRLQSDMALLYLVSRCIVGKNGKKKFRRWNSTALELVKPDL